MLNPEQATAKTTIIRIATSLEYFDFAKKKRDFSITHRPKPYVYFNILTL